MDDTLGIKFRQSKDYTHEMLVRDLIDMCGTLEKRLQSYERQDVWTPQLRIGGVQDATYTRQYGAWSRVKNMVFCQFDVQIASKGTGVGSVEVVDLPFNATPNLGASFMCTYATPTALIAGTTLMFLAHSTGNTKRASGRLISATTTTTLADTHLAATSRFIGAGVYITPDA